MNIRIASFVHELRHPTGGGGMYPKDDRGGGVSEGPKKDDVIYEQPLKENGVLHLISISIDASRVPFAK